MGTVARLPFDPIERAGELWERHFGPSGSMRLVTSVMRVQQILIAELDALLKPFDLTFARYEVLVLLTFSRNGELPLSKIGARLMVHPASVTNAIDRLEAQGLVARRRDTSDRRRTFAAVTPAGRRVVTRATRVLMAADFGLRGLDPDDRENAYDLLREVRSAAGDFDGVPASPAGSA